MRAFNFHLIHEHSDRMLSLGRGILDLTPAYNGLIFSDYIGNPVAQILQHGIPPPTVPAYLTWALRRRPTPELLEVWRWMVQNRQTDAPGAASLTTELCHREEYGTAAQLWAAWLGSDRGDYLKKDFLYNTRFAREPLKTPLDWAIYPVNGVETNRADGLAITFSGNANLAYRNVRQMSAVRPGTYIFTAVVEATEITTNEGPYFHLFDPAKKGGIDLVTDKIRGTLPRTKMEERFTVGPGTEAIVTQLERSPSDRVDSKIAGTLRIHEISLRRVE
ncbi:hypothetical protein [uncultured Paludibaculum sp.]|uniref:hypothetical protein n=1 Tax=uncultured Paludibaculum sp. TaxID=1765020 RepID=UPI002AAC0CBD|nr:hypothetical protein [uncultured Paludibaculum sp.]